jgi:hypothetical protein
MSLLRKFVRVPSANRERVTHFTETLVFLSDSAKDWVMSRAILQRLIGPNDCGGSSEPPRMTHFGSARDRDIVLQITRIGPTGTTLAQAQMQ